MHGPINVKSPNNTSKWQMGFNSAFKGLKCIVAFYANSVHTNEPYFYVRVFFDDRVCGVTNSIA